MVAGQICGSRCSGLCEQSDRVGCSLRTALRSRLEGLTQSSGEWKRSVTPAGRSWWVLGMSGRHIDEIGSGSWATPVAHDVKERNTQYKQGGESLTRQVTWPTPVSQDAWIGAERQRQGTASLAKEANWPTPVALDAKSTGASGYSTLTGRHSGVTLSDAVDPGSAGLGPLERWSRSIPGSRVARLNAKWVAVLMGFPEDWLSVDGSERSRRLGAQLSRKSLRQSGSRS
jgi:hypothetical protein